jgi:hypothetical protein
MLSDRGLSPDLYQYLLVPRLGIDLPGSRAAAVTSALDAISKKKGAPSKQKPNPADGTAAVGMTQGEIPPAKQKKTKKMPHQMSNEELQKAIFEHRQKLKEQKGNPNDKAYYIPKNLHAAMEFLFSDAGKLNLGDFEDEIRAKADQAAMDFFGAIEDLADGTDYGPGDTVVIAKAYKKQKKEIKTFKKNLLE